MLERKVLLVRRLEHVFIGEKGEKRGELLVCEICIWWIDGEGYGQG
jgi:hypothetical protein